MNSFSIKDIENLSGIKAHTLRIWEQRYRIIVPKRKDSLHRYFDNDDLKKILRISYLYHNGYRISKIAALSDDDILKRTVTEIEKDTPPSLIVNQLLEAGIDFNEQKFEEIFLRTVDKLGFEKTVLEIAYPYLERIGILWMSDEAIPAQEHFTSNIISRKFMLMIDALPAEVTDDKNAFVLFTPEKEHHEIPLMLMHYLLKKSGRRVFYAGSNVSKNVVAEICSEKKITHVFFQMTTNLNHFSLDDYITDLTESFPDQQIVVAGPLTKEVTIEKRNLHLLKSLNEIISFAKNADSIGAVQVSDTTKAE